jgi:SAM-dependent methyltransferase
VVTADAVRDPLSGSYDVAVMSAFIQVLSPDDARFAIKNISKVMKPGGEIYIRGYGIIDN